MMGATAENVAGPPAVFAAEAIVIYESAISVVTNLVNENILYSRKYSSFTGDRRFDDCAVD
jgi:hypothetical protein